MRRKENYDQAKLRYSGLWDAQAAKRHTLVVTGIKHDDNTSGY
jgi:hypothetical protein